jgi:anti-sigma regulatory factor (Ser/Thr protein kinase)
MITQLSGRERTDRSWRPNDSDPAPVRSARAWASQTLAAWDCRSMTDDAGLVMSELVANAINHGGGLRGVVMELHRDRLLIKVIDRRRARCALRSFSTTDECGRGLMIVDALSDHRYTEPVAGDGKTICVVLARPRYSTSRSSGRTR